MTAMPVGDVRKDAGVVATAGLLTSAETEPCTADPKSVAHQGCPVLPPLPLLAPPDLPEFPEPGPVPADGEPLDCEMFEQAPEQYE